MATGNFSVMLEDLKLPADEFGWEGKESGERRLEKEREMEEKRSEREMEEKRLEREMKKNA